MTDVVGPAPSTVAGRTLAANKADIANVLVEAREGVDIFDVPSDLLTDTAIFLAGSPAGHGPCGKKHASTVSGNVSFKEEAFYSLTWATPKSSIVMMTFGQSACGTLAFWTRPDDGRALLVTPAHFRLYRPRLGLANNLGELADQADTAIAIYAPPTALTRMVTRGSELDVRATTQAWLGSDRMVTFSSYTAELERDLFERL